MVYSLILAITLLLSIISGSESKAVVLDDVNRNSPDQFLTFVIQNAAGTSDTLTEDTIIGDLPTIKYIYHNSTLKGLKTCVVTALQIDAVKMVFKFNLECPYIEFNTDYVMEGTVDVFSVKGEGQGHVLCDNYILQLECNYEKNIGEDNKEYVHIKSFTLDATPRGRVFLDFKNLSAGDEEKTLALYNFIEENWIIMDKELREPVLKAFMNTFIKNLNGILRNISNEELLTGLSCS